MVLHALLCGAITKSRAEYSGVQPDVLREPSMRSTGRASVLPLRRGVCTWQRGAQFVAVEADLVERDGLEAEFPGGGVALEGEVGGAGRVTRRANEGGSSVGEVVLQREHGGRGVPIDVQPFADADVSGYDVALGRHTLERGAFDRRTAGG